MRPVLCFALACFLFAIASRADASPATRACVQAARAEARECKALCTEANAEARDACHNKDPECIDACRAGREDCRTASGLGEEIAACNAIREDAVGSCREAHPPATTERDLCVDAAQLASFVCRDDAREANRAELRVCAVGFRGCHRACPRVPTPPADVASCRAEAKDAFRTCKLDCAEDWQIAKDACIGNDHACVEDCRAQRSACVDAAEGALGVQVAACNETRDAAIAQCAGDDTCIDAAQAAAFQCRDGARELYRPAFAACRDAFQACVVGPPGCAMAPAP